MGESALEATRPCFVHLPSHHLCLLVNAGMYFCMCVSDLRNLNNLFLAEVFGKLEMVQSKINLIVVVA